MNKNFKNPKKNNCHTFGRFNALLESKRVSLKVIWKKANGVVF